MTTLDIVISAYKGRYLEELLQSLSVQTSQEFGVIVCDDASPDPIEKICESFQQKLNLHYVRFNGNLGKLDLAAQWNRSIRQSIAEWIMLPGDDDMIDPNCVAAFHNTLRVRPNSVDVWSFPIRIIDGNGTALRETKPTHARNAEEYFYHYIRGTICPMPVGFIFSRHIFDAFDGFVSFSAGMYSDAATIGLFCSQRGIRAIEGAYSYWRESEINISPRILHEPLKMAQVNLDFFRWMSASSDSLKLSRETTRRLVENDSWNMYRRIGVLPFSVWLWAVFRYSPTLAAHGNRSTARHIFRFARERWSRNSQLTGSAKGVRSESS